MPRVRVKFCGLTCAEDAAAAARLGVDAIGMVFYPAARTAVDAAAARAVAAALPPFVARVALFVNPAESEVQAAIAAARPHCLQFHGEESPAFCASFGRPHIKAVRVRSAADIARAQNDDPAADGILLDAFSETAPGGSGESFRWELARAWDFADPRLIVAGGLTAANVGEALATAAGPGNIMTESSPALSSTMSGADESSTAAADEIKKGRVGVGVGVDVSSGIARADDRRRKDFFKMQSFMEAVRDATAAAATTATGGGGGR